MTIENGYAFCSCVEHWNMELNAHQRHTCNNPTVNLKIFVEYGPLVNS